MEELQDWLADARYSASLVEGKHKPMKLIPLPPAQGCLTDEFFSSLELSAKSVLTQPLGIYFMSRFIDDVCPEERWRHDVFVQASEVARGEGDSFALLGELVSNAKMHAASGHLPQDLVGQFIKEAGQVLNREPPAVGQAASKYAANKEETSNVSETKVIESTTASSPSTTDDLLTRTSMSILEVVTPLLDFVTPGYAGSKDSALFMRFLKTAGSVGARALRSWESSNSSTEMFSHVSMGSVLSTSSTGLHNVLPDGHIKGGNAPVMRTLSRTQRYLIGDKLAGKSNADKRAPIHWLDKYIETLWWSRMPIRRDDMAIFRDIGRGAFGIVSGVTCVYTGKMFALKAMDRKLIKGKRAEKLVIQEFDILSVLVEKPSRFVVSLHYSFADDESLYFCLNLLTGGDLRYHLDEIKKFRPAQARFFTAQIAMGIGHLHSLGIIYRDLKPENIMLDEKGNAVITDLGLAHRLSKENPYMKHRAGTSGYWAPEVITKTRYTYSADWWSLGATCYELVRGLSPFSRRITGLETRDAGISSDIPIKFNPKFFQGFAGAEALIAMLKGLLERNPEKRVASLDRLKGCDFFKSHGSMPSLDWERLKHGALPSPFKPDANGAINAENAQVIAQASTLKTASFRKIDVSAEDMLDITSVAVLQHQKDIIEVLDMELSGELDFLFKRSNGCCVIQ